jgi:hypothetical protein
LHFDEDGFAVLAHWIDGDRFHGRMFGGRAGTDIEAAAMERTDNVATLEAAFFEICESVAAECVYCEEPALCADPDNLISRVVEPFHRPLFDIRSPRHRGFHFAPKPPGNLARRVNRLSIVPQ